MGAGTKSQLKHHSTDKTLLSEIRSGPSSFLQEARLRVSDRHTSDYLRPISLPFSAAATVVLKGTPGFLFWFAP